LTVSADMFKTVTDRQTDRQTIRPSTPALDFGVDLKHFA